MAARKSAAIVETARRLFLERGYDGTSVDEVAAASGVSKTTVYNNFADKEALFTAVILDVTGRAETIVAALSAELAAAGTPAERLERAGRRLASGVLQPTVVQLRRIAVAEAPRFPQLVAEYWDRAPGRTIAVLAEALVSMDAAGELEVPDARHAATHLAYAILGPYQDRALLQTESAPAQKELDGHVKETVARFVRAYAPPAGFYSP